MTLKKDNHNLKLINILSFLSELNFREGILMLFLSKYLSWSEIALLLSTLIITKTIFEIPTGVFADRYSRRLSLFLSFLLFAGGLFVITISHSLIFAFATFILWGISDAFYSGSQESLLYDTLRETGEEENFGQKESERMAWFEGGIIFASISGGFLFDINPNLPFLVMGIVYVFSAALSLFVVEPGKKEKIVQPLTGYLRELKSNVRLMLSGQYLRKSLLYTLLVLAVVMYVVSEFFDETGLILKGLNGISIGIIFSLTSVMSLLANITYKKWKDLRIGIIALGIFLTLLATVTGYLQIMIVAVLIRCGLWAMLEIRSKTTINHAVPSKYRTSLLSTFSFLSELPFVILAPMFGIGIDKFGFSFTLATFVLLSSFLIFISQIKSLDRLR
jgi:MFS family permease